MMKRVFGKLLSPSFWVAVFSILACGGAVCFIVGIVSEMEWLKTLGIWLFSPLLVGGVLLVVVGIPILIFANRKQEGDGGDLGSLK